MDRTNDQSLGWRNLRIGDEILSSSDSDYCCQKGVKLPFGTSASTPVPSPISSCSSSIVSHGTSSTNHEQSPKVSTTSESSSVSIRASEESRTSTTISFDDVITGCYINCEDLHYGGKTLGQGTFGRVYKGTWHGADVAVKEMQWDDEDDTQRREVSEGFQLAHPNIVQIMGWSRKDELLLVVMPLFRKGSLADRLGRVSKDVPPTPRTGGPFGFDFAFGISIGLLRAIKYLADRKPNPFIHRDIKPANALLDDNDQPMLTDFGTAKSLRSTFATTMGGIGTPFYMSPEQALEEGVSTATDVYSVSLVIYDTFCTPGTVRKSKKFHILMKEVMDGDIPPMHDMPTNIANILTQALAKESRLKRRDNF